MEIISDLHLHSRYSRAVSPEMTIAGIYKWARLKGIDLVATADFLHPLWIREIKANLEEDGSGFLRMRGGSGQADIGPLFLLSVEVSGIYSQNGRVRRVHTLIFVPTVAEAEKLTGALLAKGVNLGSDGRPIMGMTARDLAALVLDISPTALIVPAHVWTPWFSLFGSKSGYDVLSECFGDMSKYICAVETGISSDPAMNWRIAELDGLSIVSFSDAHSGPKIGREATVFGVQSATHSASSGRARKVQNQELGTEGFSYNDLYKAISQDKNGRWEIVGTIEFFPEEGKYHYTGHRNCDIRQSPPETRRFGTTCPVCGKPLTVGTMHRVDELAGRTEAELKIEKKLNQEGVVEVYSDFFPHRPGYVMLVPLLEIIAEALGGLPGSKKVAGEYARLVEKFGSEFAVLLKAPVSEIAGFSGPRVGMGIERVRRGELSIEPGYDGVFGKVKIWEDGGEEKMGDESSSGGQMRMF